MCVISVACDQCGMSTVCGVDCVRTRPVGGVLLLKAGRDRGVRTEASQD